MIKFASDLKGIGMWLAGCGTVGVICSIAVSYKLDNLGLALACGTLGFLLASRMFEWPFEVIIGVPTVESIKREEGLKEIAASAPPIPIRDLEDDRRIYRFFQAAIYIREARDTITTSRSRELISLLLGVIVVMLTGGYAVLSGGTAPTHVVPPNDPLLGDARDAGRPRSPDEEAEWVGRGGRLERGDAGGAVSAGVNTASNQDMAWRVMLGLVPLFVHAVTLWIPLILQQTRHQKL